MIYFCGLGVCAICCVPSFSASMSCSNPVGDPFASVHSFRPKIKQVFSMRFRSTSTTHKKTLLQHIAQTHWLVSNNYHRLPAYLFVYFHVIATAKPLKKVFVIFSVPNHVWFVCVCECLCLVIMSRFFWAIFGVFHFGVVTAG